MKHVQTQKRDGASPFLIRESQTTHKLRGRIYPYLLGIVSVCPQTARPQNFNLRNLRYTSPRSHGIKAFTAMRDGRRKLERLKMKGKSKGKSKGKAVNVPAVVSVEIPTREQLERAREARVKEIRRTLAKCGDEMERGRTRFVLVCDPSHIYAVRQYLAQAWGEYAPKVEAGLIVTAAKKPVNAKAAK